MRHLTGAYTDARALFALRYLRDGESARSDRVLSARSGLKLSRKLGRGVDLAEVRLYQPGDDVRSIDWRVTARKSKPHTKVFREERERPTLIFVDQSQSMFFGSRRRLKSVAAAEFAGRLAWQTLHANDRVGGLVLGNTGYGLSKPRRSFKHTARFLGALAEHNRALSRGGQAEDAQLAAALVATQRLARSGFRVVLISDFSRAEAAWSSAVTALARRNQVSVVQIYDPLEQELPPADLYSVTDGQTRLRLNTGDTGLRRHYARSFQVRSDALTQLCAHPSIRLLRYATTDTDPPLRQL